MQQDNCKIPKFFCGRNNTGLGTVLGTNGFLLQYESSQLYSVYTIQINIWPRRKTAIFSKPRHSAILLHNQNSSNNNMKHHNSNNNLSNLQNNLGSKLSAKATRRISLFQKGGGEDQEKTQALQKTRSSKWSPDGHARARQMQQVDPSQ